VIDTGVIAGQLETLWTQAVSIWLSGGWAMIAIAVVALLMFGIGVNLQLKLRDKGFLRVPEKTWRRWIAEPAERRGVIGELLDEVMAADSLRELSRRFAGVRSTELPPLARDLGVMKVFVGAAPLLGLLGTVIGMLTTFEGLATGGGGDETMGLVAKGISEALITTETGLVVSLPGLFFQYQLKRKFERYKAFLAHLETVCAQELYRSTRRGRAA